MIDAGRIICSGTGMPVIGIELAIHNSAAIFFRPINRKTIQEKPKQYTLPFI